MQVCRLAKEERVEKLMPKVEYLVKQHTFVIRVNGDMLTCGKGGVVISMTTPDFQVSEIRNLIPAQIVNPTN